jgi:hypothetical protein
MAKPTLQRDEPSISSALDQRWKRCRSTFGTPSNSAMIVVGTA